MVLNIYSKSSKGDMYLLVTSYYAIHRITSFEGCDRHYHSKSDSMSSDTSDMSISSKLILSFLSVIS